MLPYRKCVSIVLRKHGLIFVGERVDCPNAWQLPQGGVVAGETWVQTAKRELFEETGVSSVKFKNQTQNAFRYDFPEDAQQKMLNEFGKLKYKGQEVGFVELEFIGEDSEIDLDHDTKEFNNWQWATAEVVLQSIVQFKYNCYKRAFFELNLLH